MKLLQPGSLVTATACTELCDPGERGVCYVVTDNLEGEGFIYGIVFAFGKYGGFTDESVKALLHFTGETDPTIANYEFKDSIQLCNDWMDGLFRQSFNR